MLIFEAVLAVASNTDLDLGSQEFRMSTAHLVPRVTQTKTVRETFVKIFPAILRYVTWTKPSS